MKRNLVAVGLVAIALLACSPPHHDLISSSEKSSASGAVSVGSSNTSNPEPSVDTSPTQTGEPAGTSSADMGGPTPSSPAGEMPSSITGEISCPEDSRVCDGHCVSRVDPLACGTECSVCPIPAGGKAVCDGSSCSVVCDSGRVPCGSECIPEGQACNASCNAGTHECNGQCAPDDSVSACGAQCQMCPVPEGAERALCSSGKCEIQCKLGAHLCDSSCKSETDPTACGAACVSCTAGAHQTSSCLGGQCHAACDKGYHLCDAGCLSDSDVNSCGSSCQACPVPTGGNAACNSGQCAASCPSSKKLCLGACIDTGSACNGQCPSGQHACNGLCADNTLVNSCGASCMPCSLPTGATRTTCVQSACDFDCGPGTVKCGNQCLSGTGPAECGAQCTKTVGPKLIVIPKGDLLVGQDDLDYAKVRVQSHFETFCMDQTEVTVADYKACVDAGKCQTPNSLTGCNWGVAGKESHPVSCIDWPRADAYCKWAGKRLPSEWEWEFAARGSEGRSYPWGETAPATKYLNWKYEAGATSSVGSYPDGATLRTNLYDMSGNVWEWTSSVYCDSKAAGAACKTGAYTARGGSYGSQLDIHVRGAWRDPDSAGDARFGFRCAAGNANP